MSRGSSLDCLCPPWHPSPSIPARRQALSRKWTAHARRLRARKFEIQGPGKQKYRKPADCSCESLFKTLEESTSIRNSRKEEKGTLLSAPRLQRTHRQHTYLLHAGAAANVVRRFIPHVRRVGGLHRSWSRHSGECESGCALHELEEAHGLPRDSKASVGLSESTNKTIEVQSSTPECFLR